MWCVALIMQNPRGFMRLFICLQRWKRAGCCCSVSVLTLGWTHGTNAVVQRSLALIPALVKRHSCFSSPAALLVNLQQNSLLLQSERWKPTHRLSSAQQHASEQLITSDPHDTFQLLHGMCSPLLFVFISSSSNEPMKLCSQGSRAATVYILAAELLKSPHIIYSRFP